MGKYKNLIGEKFGRLTVVSRANYKINNKIVYECKCDCGNTVFIKSCNLTRNTRPTKSCGCIHAELNKTRGIVHNMRKHRLYPIWAGMKYRCHNTNSPVYEYYGGRGIKICDEWANSFMTFYNWAINNGYDEKAEIGKCTIDRINVDGNYEPNNCRWVDMKVQVNNRRKKELDF